MTLWIVLLPFIAALFPIILQKQLRTILTGWFVLPIPVIASIFFMSKLSSLGQTLFEKITGCHV